MWKSHKETMKMIGTKTATRLNSTTGISFAFSWRGGGSLPHTKGYWKRCLSKAAVPRVKETGLRMTSREELLRYTSLTYRKEEQNMQFYWKATARVMAQVSQKKVSDKQSSEQMTKRQRIKIKKQPNHTKQKQKQQHESNEAGHKPDHKSACLNFKASTSSESNSVQLYVIYSKEKASVFSAPGLYAAQCCGTNGSQQLLPLNP